jgi:hypothetical protein
VAIVPPYSKFSMRFANVVDEKPWQAPQVCVMQASLAISWSSGDDSAAIMVGRMVCSEKLGSDTGWGKATSATSEEKSDA